MLIILVAPVPISVVPPAVVVVATVKIGVMLMPAGMPPIPAFSYLLVASQLLEFVFCARDANGLTGVVFPQVLVTDGAIAAGAASFLHV